MRSRYRREPLPGSRAFSEAVSTNYKSCGMKDTVEEWRGEGKTVADLRAKGFDERLTIALPTEWSALKPGSMS